VRTLAELNCKVLLEIGPRPVLTATALGAWPDPATAPRAIATQSRNTADHRQITEAVADAYVLGHLPEFAAFRQADARKLDLPTYPFERRQYWFRDNQEQAKPQPRLSAPTQAVRLLEDGRIEELAALLDGSGDDPATLSVLTKLAAQHNQQRMTQSIADDRYEIRWETSTAALSDADAGEGSAWILIGDDTNAIRPLVDVLTAGGHRHRIVGLPVSDAEEEQLAVALRAAAADDSTLRILHVAGLDADLDSQGAPSMQSLLRMQHRILGGTPGSFALRQPLNCAGPSGW
jgi:acyl transferase domain-containing protein